MNEVNIFEAATRRKYRFPFRGLISVEDLWDIPMKNLDDVFKALNSQKKVNNEESLIATKSVEDEELEDKIAIVKYIYSFKLNEQNERIAAKEQKQRDQKILEIISRKENEALEGKSIEELQAMLGK